MRSKANLRQIIHDMSYNSKEFKEASAELQSRGFGVYQDKLDKPHKKYLTKYKKNYGMNKIDIVNLLEIKHSGTLGDLHRVGLLKHCIFIAKQRKKRKRLGSKK